MSTVEIHCNCGEVRMRLHGEPLVQVYCHCDDCRAAHGGAYLPAAIYPYAAVEVVAGAPGLWRRKWTIRATCPTCGTRLFAEPPGQEVRSVPASLLPAGSFKPAWHIQCQHALLPVRDDLPHFKGFPAAFGGSDETVDW